MSKNIQLTLIVSAFLVFSAAWITFFPTQNQIKAMVEASTTYVKPETIERLAPCLYAEIKDDWPISRNSAQVRILLNHTLSRHKVDYIILPSTRIDTTIITAEREFLIKNECRV